MNKIIINENEIGYLFKSGRFKKLLNAGKYYEYGDRKIEVEGIEHYLYSYDCTLDTLLSDPEIANKTSVIDIQDNQIALHYIDGKYCDFYLKGKFAFWNALGSHEFKLYDITDPKLCGDFPKNILPLISRQLYQKVEVAEYQKARLYYDMKLVEILEPGTYYFWKTNVNIGIDMIDTRLTSMNISGQEIMTLDKVALRINFICNYRITDYVKTFTEIDDYEEQIHVAVQLALRDYVGSQKLDDILANKTDISDYVFEQLKAKEADFYVDFKDAGVKDIILPGEIREIMNTVLIAEKRSQANVITRREEVASTRSLLNTAKLMDENTTLFKLKELEHIERICENVGNINLNGNSDVLSQLVGLLQSSKV